MKSDMAWEFLKRPESESKSESKSKSKSKTMSVQHLLNRRRFLGSTMHGLSGIALTSLLSREGLLGMPAPIRPLVDTARPYAPRKPHFEPKARRVLCIFCSGALSHVDTFDYKPELVKRHDTPMPGNDKLVTFQGEQGNLIKPLWDFKPRGQSGKMMSDLLPNLAELADDMCFIHSMTAKTQHARSRRRTR